MGCRWAGGFAGVVRAVEVTQDEQTPAVTPCCGAGEQAGGRGGAFSFPASPPEPEALWSALGSARPTRNRPGDDWREVGYRGKGFSVTSGGGPSGWGPPFFPQEGLNG